MAWSSEITDAEGELQAAEKEGLVRRVPHESDRRITLVEITEAGARLAEKRLGPSQLVTATLFDDLTPKERAELLRLMTKLLHSLRARGIDLPGA
jgi:DNA-binding MarR family transcriptional regulator